MLPMNKKEEKGGEKGGFVQKKEKGVGGLVLVFPALTDKMGRNNIHQNQRN